jgi:hypothetical protein
MRTHTRAVLLAITGLLALPAGALAGGWATVGLSSTPDGLAAGAPWNVDIEVRQHGRTPMLDLHPSVAIASADERTRRTFAAHATGRPGIYRASVRFPRSGDWRYVIDDGFTQTHAYPPVRIGGSTAAAGGGGAAGRAIALDRLGLAALAGLVAAGLALAPAGVRSRRRERAAAAAAGGAFFNAGQVCAATGRVLAHERIVPALAK